MLTVYNTWVDGLPCGQGYIPPRMGDGGDRQSYNRHRWIKRRIELGNIVEEQDEGSGTGRGIKYPGIKW